MLAGHEQWPVVHTETHNTCSSTENFVAWKRESTSTNLILKLSFIAISSWLVQHTGKRERPNIVEKISSGYPHFATQPKPTWK